jgi:selenide,water dikinase
LLAQVLCQLEKTSHPDLLVGIDTSDDAAVYRISKDTALVQTLDFFTPVVDDPYTFGQIAAANALSDIYAMGGRPILALNIVCFPRCLDISVLSQILKGGQDKVLESGAILVGGHSIEDDEPKYGLSVSGSVHPSHIITNTGAKPGDVLILTKPLGVGIINTAIKAEMASRESLEQAILSMTTLNNIGETGATMPLGIHSITDITGFGFLGHAYEMAKGSQVTLHIESKNIPLLIGAVEYSEMGLIPAGAYRNRDYFQDGIEINKSVPLYLQDILYDPQTSGGLLISVGPEKLKNFINGLKGKAMVSALVGTVSSYTGMHIVVK